MQTRGNCHERRSRRDAATHLQRLTMEKQHRPGLLCRIGLHDDVQVLSLSPYTTWPPPDLTYAVHRECLKCGRKVLLVGAEGHISNWIDMDGIRNTRVHREGESKG